MSTKIQPKRGLLVDKSVHENSPKVSTKIHQKCPRKFTLFVHENLPFMSTRSLPPIFGQIFSQSQAGYQELIKTTILDKVFWTKYIFLAFSAVVAIEVLGATTKAVGSRNCFRGDFERRSDAQWRRAFTMYYGSTAAHTWICSLHVHRPSP